MTASNSISEGLVKCLLMCSYSLMLTWMKQAGDGQNVKGKRSRWAGMTSLFLSWVSSPAPAALPFSSGWNTSHCRSSERARWRRPAGCSCICSAAVGLGAGPQSPSPPAQPSWCPGWMRPLEAAERTVWSTLRESQESRENKDGVAADLGGTLSGEQGFVGRSSHRQSSFHQAAGDARVPEETQRLSYSCSTIQMWSLNKCMCVCACRPGVLRVTLLCGFSVTCLGLLGSRGCGRRKAHVTAGPFMVIANDVTVLTVLVLVQIRAFCSLTRVTTSLSAALWPAPQPQKVVSNIETNQTFLLWYEPVKPFFFFFLNKEFTFITFPLTWV